MKNLKPKFDTELILIALFVVVWLGFAVVMLHELSTVRPNVLKILQGK